MDGGLLGTAMLSSSLDLVGLELDWHPDQTNKEGRSHRKVRNPIRCFPPKDVRLATPSLGLKLIL